MSPEAERAAFAAAGRDLIATRGGPGRRAYALTSRPTAAPPTAFAILLDAPEWLRWLEDEQRRLAEVVALRLIAPTLARSIDGAWLGSLAKVAGDDALDWAIDRGSDEEVDDAIDVEHMDAKLQADALAPYGLAILSGQLPAPLRSYLRGAAAGAVIAGGSIVAEALAFIRERAR